MTMKPLRGGMGRRMMLAAFLLLVAPASAWEARAGASEPSAAARRAVVEAASKSAVVPPELALAVARAGAPARGGVLRAVGVMGIRPSLARAEFGVGAGALRGVDANAGLGVALLERLYGRHGGRWDLALSHYRGGPPARCGSGPVVHDHTLAYVAEVMEWWRRYQDDGTVAATDPPGGVRRARATEAGRFGATDRPARFF